MNSKVLDDENANFGKVRPEWRLTIKELKSHSGFENVTEDEAETIIDIFVNLARTINLIYTNTK